MLFKETVFKLKLDLTLLILSALGFSFFTCQSKEDRKTSYKLRYEIYGREGYINPDAYLDNLMTDEFDKNSIQILGTFRGRAIATARIILSSKKGFPVEKLFNIKTYYPKNKTAEISRLGIHPDFRSSNSKYSRFVMLGVAALMYKESCRIGIDYWLAGMAEKLAGSFKPFGADFEKLREYTPTRENKKARGYIDGYFKRSPIHPYLTEIREIPKKGLALSSIIKRKKKHIPTLSGNESPVQR